MKNIFIIHGYNGVPKIHKWLKNELENIGYNVIMPEFPPREGVIYNDWKKILDNYKDKISKDSIFIAHSIGNLFVIKYLVENNIKIKLYISLAGFSEYFEVEGRDLLNRAVKNFLINEKEVEIFKQNVNIKYSIYSNDDHIVPFDVLKSFSKTIDSKPIMIENIGHMGRKSGLENIPKVLEIITKEENI